MEACNVGRRAAGASGDGRDASAPPPLSSGCRHVTIPSVLSPNTDFSTWIRFRCFLLITGGPGGGESPQTHTVQR